MMGAGDDSAEVGKARWLGEVVGILLSATSKVRQDLLCVKITQIRMRNRCGDSI